VTAVGRFSRGLEVAPDPLGEDRTGALRSIRRRPLPVALGIRRERLGEVLNLSHARQRLLAPRRRGRSP